MWAPARRLVGWNPKCVFICVKIKLPFIPSHSVNELHVSAGRKLIHIDKELEGRKKEEGRKKRKVMGGRGGRGQIGEHMQQGE